MPVSMLYFKLSSALMRDVSYDSALPSVNGMFTLSSQVHNYNTRSSSAGNFYRKYYRLNHHKLFARVGAKSWKSIPENLRKLPKHAFRKQIHNPLLLDLQRQDCYADIDTLINEMKKGSS